MDYVELDAPAGAVAEDLESEPALGWDEDRLRGEIARLRDDMLRAASEMRFEEAAGFRDRLKKLEAIELRR